MTRPQRHRHADSREIILHDDEDSYNQDPAEFLDRNHPANDDYMKAIEHVQKKLMVASRMLRTKQVQIIKSVFAGKNYADAAAENNCHPQTVSRLVKKPEGATLLSLLQYHLKLLEGPNEALRRNMIWRIAVINEKVAPKIALQAIAELNKMHFQQKQLDNPDAGGARAPAQVTININQNVLPKGSLDR